MRKSFPSRRLKIPLFLLVIFSLIIAFFSWQHFSLQSFTVTEITDGDTIKLNDGRTIRYIGLDAPEEGECFAQEAKGINERLVLGKKVRVEMDINEMDRVGSSLDYLILEEM